MIRIGWQILFVAFCVTLSLSGCGRKTLPIPPHAVIPQAINDLNFFQDESRVVLSWTYPGETTIGTELKSIEGFQIFRAVIPEADFCETCPVPFSSSIDVPFDQAVLDRKKQKAQYTETVLRPAHRYVYKVRCKAGWRLISDDSNVISFSWDSPTVAPDAVVLTPGDKEITVSWLEVTTRTDGTSLQTPLKYQVYRSTDNNEFVPVGDPVSGTKFRDLGLINGQAYKYKVRAVFNQGTNAIYGIASGVSAGEPRDLTAPIPPHNLTVVKVADGVKLIWERGEEPDIAGYRIFRRNGTGEERQLVGETGVRQTFFVDKTAPAKQKLLYSITSFDRARPANESLFSREAQYEPF